MYRIITIVKQGLLICVVLISFKLLLLVEKRDNASRQNSLREQPVQNELFKTAVISAKNQKITQNKKKVQKHGNRKTGAEKAAKPEAKLKVVYASLDGCMKHSYLPEYKAFCFTDNTYHG